MLQRDETEVQPVAEHTDAPLSDKHRAELHASGITDETIAAAGIYTTSNGAIAKLLGWQPKQCDWGVGLVYPYAGGYSRVKLDFPRSYEGKPIKYESPKNAPNRAYFPPGFWELLPRTAPIVLTEGEKKTLAIQQAGFTCIGLSGVWNWQQKRLRTDTGRAYGKRELISDLAAIDWTGRAVVILFDSDAASNSSVRLAECRLAEALAALGATVRIARIPADGESKVGADDYIVAHGVDAFRNLLDDAKPAEKPPALSSMDLARLYVEEFWTAPEGVMLRAYRDEYYAYADTHYTVTPKKELQSLVLDWQDRLMQGVKPRHAGDTVEAIYAVCRVPFNVEMPVYLGASGHSQPNWLAFTNGILDLDAVLADEKVELRPHTPQWFSQFSLPYDYDPAAECPTWYTTLDEIFDNGSREHAVECVHALSEFFGYVLTADTTQHKMLFLEGPRRTGKSTVLKVLEATVGKANTASPTLTSLGDTFGLWPLLGKRLAIFADAHLGSGDKGLATLERLKAISGEDPVDVHRKFLPSLTGVRLPIRFALACNELPRFSDNADALASRLLILPFRNSFLGREDRQREAKLRTEASGILNWALAGLRRLRKQSRFTIPKASEDALVEFERHTSPVKAFIGDRCELGANYTVARDTLWTAWREWADSCGQKQGTKSLLGVRLRSLLPDVGRSQPRDGGSRLDLYSGLQLK